MNEKFKWSDKGYPLKTKKQMHNTTLFSKIVRLIHNENFAGIHSNWNIQEFKRPLP